MALDDSDIPEEYRDTVSDLRKTINFYGKIDKGANGFLIWGMHKLLKRKVAVKFYYWGDGSHIEPALLSHLENPSILKVDHADAINNENAFFITRFCEGGDLDDKLDSGPIDLQDAIHIIQQVALGASYIHGEGYLHRDLKPSNIFLEATGSFVIGDFGSVVKIEEGDYALALTKHSIIYRPPEDFDGNLFYRSGDTYQLGIVFFQLLGGFFPYEVDEWLTSRERYKRDKLQSIDAGVYENQVIEGRIKKGKLLNLKSLPPWVGNGLLRVIRKACNIKQEKRYKTVSDFVTALNNVMGDVTDWRYEHGCWVAHKKGKLFRAIERSDVWVVEKRVSKSWRLERALKPENFNDAIEIIEKL